MFLRRLTLTVSLLAVHNALAQLQPIYVDSAATGAESGDDWPTAYRTLQLALAEAAESIENDEIWVAAATYRLGNPSAPDRTVTFEIPNGVLLFGGFLGNAPGGGETSRSQRNPELNDTILDGDILNNDNPGVPSTLTDNAYHVVLIGPVAAEITRVSGFTIRNGNADGSGDALSDRGGGVLVSGRIDVTSGQDLNRLRIINNRALTGGAGLCARKNAKVNLTNGWFQNNVVTAGDGGAIYLVSSGLNAQNCRLIENGAPGGAAGALAISTEEECAGATLANCTLYGNSASVSPTAILSDCSLATGHGARVLNSIVWSNGTVPITQNTNTVEVSYSDVQDNFWLSNGVANQNADPSFRQTGTHPFRVRICSIAIDTGDDNRRVADTPDIDENGNFAELTPLEARMLTRVAPILVPDPNSDGLIVDRGAYEEQCYCPGDLNDTNDVDLSDLAALLSCFGTTACAGACCMADLDCDNDVDLQDLAILLAHFGESCCAGSFAGGSGGGDSSASDGAGADDALTQWLRSATPEEVLDWYYAGMPW